MLLEHQSHPGAGDVGSWPRLPASVQGRRTTALLAWDGRLDNPDDVYARYRHAVRGHRGDAYLALAAFEVDGPSGLRHLVGDWSAVFEDPSCGEVVLASDFAGVRPLYYSVSATAVCWSPHLDALVRATGLTSIDEKFIAGFLRVGGCPNHTPYQGIRSVPPGQAVCVTRDRLRVVPFWTAPLATADDRVDIRACSEELLRLFREAVRVRICGHRHVVAELSGGLDSTSVVCMADELIRDGSVRTTLVQPLSYAYHDSKDLPFIRDVEHARSTSSAYLSLDETPVFSPDSSSAWPGAAPPIQYAAAAKAREHGATAFLTGQGGDLVTGNRLDDSLQVARLLRSGQWRSACREAYQWSAATSKPAPVILAAAFRECLPRGLRIGPSSTTVRAALSEASMVPAFCARTDSIETDDLFSRDWQSAPAERRSVLKGLGMLRELRSLQPSEPLREFAYTHPFCHRPLVEFLIGLPPHILCGPREPRRLMRQALGHLWPASIRGRRSKSLFGAPYFDAFLPFARQLLARSSWQVVERGWVDPQSMCNRLERFVRGLRCNEAQLRQIMTLEAWLDSDQRATGYISQPA